MKMMDRQSNKCREAADTLYAALEMERRAVGVKLLLTEEAYQKAEAKVMLRPANYCQMVAAASKGNGIKCRQEHIRCTSGIRVLGFDHTDLQNAEGENWMKLGLYKSPAVSRKMRRRIGEIPEKTYGLLVQPAESFEEIPDVILIITNPYNVMRLTQGYAYHYGEAKHIRMAGNQAICLECTAAPYVNDEMNTSTLCIGTRHQAGWKDTEMAIGIPGAKFADTVQGVVLTMNIMESDAKKEQIERKMQAAGIEYPKMKYHYNYYMDC